MFFKSITTRMIVFGTYFSYFEMMWVTYYQVLTLSIKVWLWSKFLQTCLVYVWLMPRVTSLKYSKRAPTPYRIPMMSMELWYINRYPVRKSVKWITYVEILNVYENYSTHKRQLAFKLCYHCWSVEVPTVYYLTLKRSRSMVR